MLVMGVVQSLMALSTASPTLSETFGVLVSLAVVTNVIPYIVALSALPLMMQTAGVEQGKYRLNVAIALVGMLYSTYAIFASGTQAVMGGTLVMAIGFIIWGFIAHRFVLTRRAAATAAAIGVIALLALAPDAYAQAAKKTTAPAAKPAAVTLDRVKSSGTLKLGYRTDARPFSFKDASGNPAGYSVDLCRALGEAVKSQPGQADVKVEWVPITAENQLQAVEQHTVDASCAAVTVTLKRRELVDFSLPIFPGGVGVVVRSDSPKRLRNILNGEATQYTPTWKAVALNVLREQMFATVPGTTAEQWIKERGQEFKVEFTVTPVSGYEAGIQAVLDRKASAFFAERAILLDAVKSHKSADDLLVLDRQYTYERLALPIQRGDDDFRLLVDRTLSKEFESAGYRGTYEKWFGEPNEKSEVFFRWNALPE
jgi:putrescine:ornithine antiporter